MAWLMWSESARALVSASILVHACRSIILCTNTGTCTAIVFEPHLREPHLALTKHTVTKHFFLPHVCALPARTTEESPLYIIFTTISPCYCRVAVVYYVPPCVHTWTCIWVGYLHCQDEAAPRTRTQKTQPTTITVINNNIIVTFWSRH